MAGLQTTLNMWAGQFFSWARDLWELLTSTPSLVQMAILLLCFLLTRLGVRSVRRLFSSLSRLFSRSRTGTSPGDSIRQARLNAVAFPLLLFFLVWLAYAATAAYGYSTIILRPIAILILAWTVIRFVATFFHNAFWARTFSIVAWAVAALAVFNLLTPIADTLDGFGMSLGGHRISVLSVLQGGFLLVVCVWLAGLTSKVVQAQIGRTPGLDISMRALLGKIIHWALIAFAVIFALDSIGVDLTTFAVFTGALGVGLGFGLQKIISNFISGMILLMDKSLKPGDVIEIQTVSGTTYGSVDRLNARYTSVSTRDGTETLIPNENFITNPVTNWTHSHNRVRIKLPLGVAYDTDLDQAIGLVVEATTQIERVLEQPAPVCHVKNFGASSIDLEARFWIADAQNGVSNISSKVYLSIWRSFKLNGIEIPFPQTDLHIRSIPGKNA